ncbi:GTP cyclohydrolase FolE2 [Desulfomicrobium escambiense]|uniref:GTP cyclohydrolase FolE2 n=1 Tax=Desulfomicrobium escambiense TaxID=29503 RepID=UPI0003F6D1E9|nr:GTP cyclohydrolase FolE2 [Desulfomicrobium escambiense]
MRDVQSGPADVALRIDRVGVKNLSVPLTVRDRARGRQQTVARVDLSVDLPAEFKGTHMSRFLEALRDMETTLDTASCGRLLQDLRDRLQARSSHLCFHFTYFLEQRAPVTGSPALMDYACFLRGTLMDGGVELVLGVEVPVMTVCPCSKAISAEGAHSQRAMVRIEAGCSGMLWLEDLIAIAQESGSSPVYALLKREDEKFVTEAAFASPTFVEDVVRNAASRLAAHPKVRGFRVEVESFESIHNHSAYARIDQMGVDETSGRDIVNP